MACVVNDSYVRILGSFREVADGFAHLAAAEIVAHFDREASGLQ
jgi:hypothetical protein